MENEKLIQRIEELEKIISELKSTKGKTFWRRAYSKFNVVIGVFFAAFVTTAVLYAVPNTFVDGNVISADEVNANFSNLESRVAAIEGNTGLAALSTRVEALEILLDGVKREIVTVGSYNFDTLIFSGMNVQIVSGSGSTGGSLNGYGNLIIGYNEPRTSGNVRSGSHNLILGDRNNYSLYGGIVAGYNNTISAIYASILAGQSCTASGNSSAILGGSLNTASGTCSTISGGQQGTASGQFGSITGGANGVVDEDWSTVCGGNSLNTDSEYQVIP